MITTPAINPSHLFYTEIEFAGKFKAFRHISAQRANKSRQQCFCLSPLAQVALQEESKSVSPSPQSTSRRSCSWTRGPTRLDTEGLVGHWGMCDCWLDCRFVCWSSAGLLTPGRCVCVQVTAWSWPCRITGSEGCIEVSAPCSMDQYPSLQWGEDAHMMYSFDLTDFM